MVQVSIVKPGFEGVRWVVSDDPGALALLTSLKLSEELVYPFADDLLALQQGVAHALDYCAPLAQQVLNLLASLGEYPVDLLAYRPISQQRSYLGTASKLVRDGTEGVELFAHPE